MAVTTLSSKFQIVIPKDIRDKLGLRAGQQLQVLPLPGRIELVPVAAPGSLRGFVSGPNDFEREPERHLSAG
jgi:AbrB family looped-hinge helix DNA binding protein